MNRFQAIVADTKTRITEISAEEVKAKLEDNSSFCLVDVREMEEWNINHLPKALPLSKGVIERDIELVIPDTDTEIVLYCGGGNRSALAADNLQKWAIKMLNP